MDLSSDLVLDPLWVWRKRLKRVWEGFGRKDGIRLAAVPLWSYGRFLPLIQNFGQQKLKIYHCGIPTNLPSS